MKAELRTLRALVSLPALLPFLAVWALIALLYPREKAVVMMLPGASAALVALLAMRIARVIEAGTWLLLPQGRRTVIRAMALLMVILSVAIGALLMWIAPDLGLLPMLAVFVHLSLLGLLLLLGIGRRVPRFFVAIYVLVCGVSFTFSLLILPDSDAALLGATALFATLWLFAAFRNRIYPLRGGRWLPALNLNPHFSGGGAPANTMLRARLSTSFLSLPVAALVLMAWAAIYHFTIGRTPIDLVRTAFGHHALMLSAVMLVLTQRYAAPARSLWLRWGGSRAEIFRLVQRNVFVDALALGGFAWLITTLLGVLRGLPIGPDIAVRTFIACFATCFLPAWLGLIWSTLHNWRQRMYAIPFIALTMVPLASQWLIALGFGPYPVAWIESLRVVLLLLVLIAARAVAAWRWNTIDWTHFRSTRRKK